ncbi:MAG: SDR family NAD(P)-dependent oxidoreductase [Acidimicrobiia bacterium]
MDLAGRSALVTGAGGGLGGATARHLVSCGMKVALFDRDDAGVRAVAAELGDAGVACTGDVNDDDAVRSAVEAAVTLGPLSLVVNVAGGGTPGERILGRDGTPHAASTFDRAMKINAYGTFNVTRLAVGAVAANEPDAGGERGLVVNTSSLAGLEGQTGQLAYAAAKAAIAGMTLPLARDLAPVGIRVCAIAPGTMETPMFARAPQSLKDALVAGVQFPKRMGRPDEFALLVESIARNGYLNGEVIRLDGALRFPPK